MPKWKAVRVRQELLEEAKKEVEKSQYPSLSEFVSEAIRLRLQTVAKERVSEYLERERMISKLQGQLFYTPKHIWVKLTPQGNIELGVSDYFQSQLEGIVHVETLKEGENVTKEEPFGMVETVAWWWIHDLYSPIDGKIVKVNKAVIDDPFILNGDPYQWIVEVQPSNREFGGAYPEFDKELDELLSFQEYKKLINQLEARPRSPLSNSQLSEIIKEIKSTPTIRQGNEG
jgi:glycine cleavage system H protein